MIRDPFLLDHEVASQLYELSRGIAPVSIRDQIMRGIETAKRLVALNITPSPGGKLLIVGGGVAGFSAAFQAIAQHLTVKVLDNSKTDKPFDLFANCSTRRIDPTFYDWPLSHWKEDSFISAPSPLHFQADLAKKVALAWRREVKRQITNAAGRLDVAYNTTFKNSDLERANKLFKYTPTGETFHSVLFTAGMGEERVWPPKREFLPPGWNPTPYRGPVFWQDDKLQTRHCGKPFRPDILIAGTGDGALQDTIRVLTGHHPAEILRDLDRELTAVASVKWTEVQYLIFTEQEKAARQYALSPNKDATQFHKNSDLVILEMLHKQFNNCITDLYNVQQNTIKKILDPYISARKDDLPRIVHLLATGQAFTWCYPANRFLVLLLSKHLLSENPTDPLLPEFRILYEHLLNDTDGSNVTIKSNVGNLPSPFALTKYDIVVIRRGIEPPGDKLYTANREPRERQMLPCQLV